jgi:hypothetical protein
MYTCYVEHGTPFYAPSVPQGLVSLLSRSVKRGRNAGGERRHRSSQSSSRRGKIGEGEEERRKKRLREGETKETSKKEALRGTLIR